MGVRGVTHAAGWTPDRLDSLKKLWLAGKSASQVAEELAGGVTRSGVLGKVRDLGLSGDGAPTRSTRSSFKPKKRAPQKPSTADKSSEVPATPAKPPVPELPGTANIETLGAHMCKWPIGDPDNTSFSFCGRRTDGRCVYCVEHARVAYQPKSKNPNSNRVYVHPSHYR